MPAQTVSGGRNSDFASHGSISKRLTKTKTPDPCRRTDPGPVAPEHLRSAEYRKPRRASHGMKPNFTQRRYRNIRFPRGPQGFRCRISAFEFASGRARSVNA